MRIAILTEGYLPELSGVTTSLQQRLRWLSSWGHEVQVHAPDYAELSDLYPNFRDYTGEVMPGVTVYPYRSRRYCVDFAREARPFTFGTVEREIRRFEPDVIHAECPERLFMGFLCRAGVAPADRMGVPATAFYHTNYLELIDDYKQQVPWLRLPGASGLLRRMVVWVYNSYDATMVSAEVVVAKLIGFGIRNTHFGSFLGVDTDVFRPGATRAEHDAPPTVVYVGRLTPDKEIDLLLAAFDLLSQRVPEVRFTIVGGGTEEGKVQAWAARHPAATVVGRVPHAETAAHYRVTDVFATACSKETFGLTVLEAMACGAPVVGPNAGGIAEVVDDGTTGLLFTPGNAEEFAGALETLVSNRARRRQMGAAAAQAAQNRTWAHGARAMLDLWEGLIARNPTAADHRQYL